ncbi:MAG: hypothetical protein JO115_05720 [Pseudonocardiales bacterium]|nr:hypothetical protein [Pseudonocardiales bacterium]MBV9140403.1 hypothetical protein [Pseudonocardiales bacterium]
MTSPESTHEDAELDTGSSTDEAPTEVNEDQAEALLTADYQTRLREFEKVETTPVVSLPVESSDLEESDLKMSPPGGQGG